jgi:uncharacterized repeat protein (TIGR01451 family)
MLSRRSIGLLSRTRLSAVLGASLLLSMVAAGPVLATHVEPVLYEGNPVCSGPGGPAGESLGFANEGVKQDPPAEATIDVGPGTVDVDITAAGVFTWTSHDVTILAVIVKGGPNANVYFYNPPPTTTDSGLHAPQGFSHIEFCWEAPPPDGSLRITKDLEGGPAEFDGSVDIVVDCGEEGTFNKEIDFPDGEVIIDDLEPGTECEVTEVDAPNAPEGFEWGDPTFTGNPATIVSDTTVTIAIVNHLNEIPQTPTLVIEKSNDATLVNNLPSADEGDTVTYTLDYTLTNGPVDNGIIEDVLPVGVTYVTDSATDSANGEFVFDGYDAATRTLTWLATEVTENGSVSYEATVDEDAAELAQPLTNTACIDSDQTDEDCADSDVFVGAPPLAETSVPTPPQTDIGSTEGSASGGSMLLVLLALAGIALAVVFVAPTPASLRKRIKS